MCEGCSGCRRRGELGQQDAQHGGEELICHPACSAELAWVVPALTFAARRVLSAQAWSCGRIVQSWGRSRLSEQGFGLWQLLGARAGSTVVEEEATSMPCSLVV